MPTGSAANVREAGERVAPGPAPVPARLAIWVEGMALSVMVTAPVLSPLPVGLKVTVMLQEPPAATLDPHELVREKSPLMATLLMLRVALPVLERTRI